MPLQLTNRKLTTDCSDFTDVFYPREINRISLCVKPSGSRNSSARISPGVTASAPSAILWFKRIPSSQLLNELVHGEARLVDNSFECPGLEHFMLRNNHRAAFSPEDAMRAGLTDFSEAKSSRARTASVPETSRGSFTPTPKSDPR